MQNESVLSTSRNDKLQRTFIHICSMSVYLRRPSTGRMFFMWIKSIFGGRTTPMTSSSITAAEEFFNGFTSKQSPLIALPQSTFELKHQPFRSPRIKTTEPRP